MAIVKVNRSGKSHKVYLTNALKADEQIGTIYNNEMFTWVEPWNGNGWGYSAQLIWFRASDGTPKYGWISAAETDKVLETNICSLAMFTETINGKTYYGFKMRRNEELYDRDTGELIEGRRAYKDRCILCESSTAGQSHPGWLSVIFLETGVGTGKYDRIVDGTNAFVDIGYDQGSTFNTNASLIGSL
ncbi:MAG: hypothetical protein K2O97_11960 [Acetatifactor sp.]|jgi:hypothetical protein|nr:hypothetical protein [Acetatifactor sp.]